LVAARAAETSDIIRAKAAIAAQAKSLVMFPPPVDFGCKDYTKPTQLARAICPLPQGATESALNPSIYPLAAM
jgi:hypothetical protein